MSPLAITSLLATLAATQPAAPDGGTSHAVLPGAWRLSPPTYWVVGATIENAGHNVHKDEIVSDILFGLSATLRWRAFGPHARLLLAPGGDRYNDTRVFASTGLRGFLPLLGTEFSYGVAVQYDARLEQHYWLAGVTPIEVGATVYRAGSWNIDVFIGARYALTGALVDSFLIDPNGFDNEDAHDDLVAARDEQPWEGFLSVVFGRRIE
jgi:hypothetical protein